MIKYLWYYVLKIKILSFKMVYDYKMKSMTAGWQILLQHAHLMVAGWVETCGV
jgi:hypothetical protein